VPAVLILGTLGALIALWLVVEPRVRVWLDRRHMTRSEVQRGIAQLEQMLAQHAAAAERRAQRRPHPPTSDRKQ
jgi:hypothetical protein